MNKLNIVLISNRAGLYGVVVVGRSLLEKCTGICDIYVINTDFTKKDKEMLVKSWVLPSFENAHFIDVDKNILNKFRLVHKNLRHRETYLKYSIPELLPEHVDRCLYLDIDMIVTGDVSPLYSVDLGDYVIGCVLDVKAMLGWSEYTAFPISDPKRYFNAGLLLINMEKWKRGAYGKKLEDFIQNNYYNLQSMDQDGFNVVFDGQWLQLENRWNSSQYLKTMDETFKGVIHLIGPSKPWHSDYTYKFSDLFFSILDRTEFKGFRPKKLSPLEIRVQQWWRKVPPYQVIRKAVIRRAKKLLKNSED